MEAKRKLELIVGDTVLLAAEQRVAAAALEASSSAAGPSGGAAAQAPVAERMAERTVSAVLGMTQQLQAALRAAELRGEQAWVAVLHAEEAHDNATEQIAEAREALSAHQKRQRLVAE